MTGIRIIGDRQTGKTEMLLAYAEKLCRTGQRVIYITRDHRLADDAFLRVTQSVDGAPGYSIRRGHGKERIAHESNGSIHFTPVSRAWHGLVADTLILDDVDPVFADRHIPSLAASPNSRMIVASL